MKRCYGCGGGGHKIRDCPILKARGREWNQAPPSGSGTSAPQAKSKGLTPKGEMSQTELTEEEKDSKRQRRLEKKARKASIIDEQLRQQRASEMIVGASSSMPMGIDVSTTEGVIRVTYSTIVGAVLVDAGTTEGDPSVDLAGFRKSDPPIY
uniref:CCHC-type domain-containing protein n=1 Tax=Solanum tuberosum TaxID=4113 RepID=M1DJ92_SOLTU